MDIDLGLLVLRLAIGPMLVVHGWNKIFGSGGIAGTTGWFEHLGLRPAWLQARVAAALEIGAGALMTIGFLTGPTAAAFVALMTVAACTDHRGKGYFVFKGGWEYTLLVAMVAVGIAATGPGEYSVDASTGFDTSGTWWAVIAGLGGVIAALGMLAVSYKPTSSTSSPHV